MQPPAPRSRRGAGSGAGAAVGAGEGAAGAPPPTNARTKPIAQTTPTSAAAIHAARDGRRRVARPPARIASIDPGAVPGLVMRME